MRKKRNKQLIAVAALSLLFVFGVVGFYSDIFSPSKLGFTAQLVPCGGVECNFCHLFQLTSNIFGFTIQILVPSIAVIMIVTGAIFMLTSGGSQDRYKSGRNIIRNAIIGFVIVYASLVIIGTVLGLIVKVNNIGDFSFTPSQGIQIQCTASGDPFNQPSVPTGPDPQCSDGADNDSDGFIDLDDPDCINSSDTSEASTGGVPVSNACTQCAAYQSVLASAPPSWTNKVQCNGNYIDTGMPVNNSSRTCRFATQSTSFMLTSLRSRNSNWIISEGFPPTVDHRSSGHFNGTAIDIVLSPPPSSPLSISDAQRLEAICNAAIIAGFSITNEYVSVHNAPNPSLLIATMPSCGAPTVTPLTTGDHLHLQGN